MNSEVFSPKASSVDRNMTSKVKGLLERLKDGEAVICGEGYLWELERRGFAKFGNFTPEVVLDHPERVRSLHEEFVLAGSDVVEAYTYYGHRSKMKMIGREDDLEALNLASLKMAREVADETGTLMAASLSNTTSYDPAVPETVEGTKAMFKEQVEWAVKGKADYIIAETFDCYSEASLALEAIKKYGQGLPAVVTMAAYCPDRCTEDIPFPVCMRKLEEEGADVVGLNCSRGPATMLPLLREVKQACKGPVASLPVVFRTSSSHKSFQSMVDPITGAKAYPAELSPCQCTRAEIRQFGRDAKELGIQYVGLCCGNAPAYLRELAHAYGRNPPAMKFLPDLVQSMASENRIDAYKNDRMCKVRGHMTGEIQ